MSETAEQTRPRAGRCANHPGVSVVGTCSVCRRPLCLTCAIPVRGTVVGAECLTSVLPDVPEPLAVALPRPRGDGAAVLGFGLVMFLSALPWSRFGDDSGFFGAWAPNWSLLAVGAALAGLGIAAVSRDADQRVTAALYAILALAVGVGAALHRLHPPSLSEPSPVPLLALLAAAIALWGALAKAIGVLRLARGWN